MYPFKEKSLKDKLQTPADQSGEHTVRRKKTRIIHEAIDKLSESTSKLPIKKKVSAAKSSADAGTERNK